MEENYLKQELYYLVCSDANIFEFIQSGSLDGIFYWDLEYPENEWMSPKFWETLGYDPDEKKHLACEWQDIIFPEDLSLAQDNFNKHCEDPGYPYDQIVRYRHKNGSTIWLRCRGLAIRDRYGKPIRMVGAHSDITSLKQAEKEISRLSAEYEKVFNGTQDALFLIKVLENGEFRYIRNNLAHQIKTSITLEQLGNKSPQELVGKEIGDAVAANYQKCLDAGESITYEEKLDLPGGKRIWLTTLTPIFEQTQITHIVGSAEDITERKNLEEKLEKYANYDELTALPNRRLFFERLGRLVIESKRDNKKFALLFLDLDGFKEINDTYGHKTGDEVLNNVGNRLLKCVRESDTVARMGGDEFTVLIRNIEDKNAVEKIALKIHQALNEVMEIADVSYRINTSIGIAIYPDHGNDSEELLKNADAAMYEIKKSGKGRLKFFA